MNDLIVKMLQSPDKLERIRKKLPPAFELVAQQTRGPEVGNLRESVLIGMFMAFLGESRVSPNSAVVEADCAIGDVPLSIKTVTGKALNNVRIKWTVDQERVREFIDAFAPGCDLLIVRILWDAEGRISYIPLEAQQRVFAALGTRHYLDYRPGTNTRGINLSRAALTALEQSAESVIAPLQWFRSVEPQSLYDRWVSYWQDD